MKARHFTAGFAALLATALCSCSEENTEPQLPPEPEQPAISGVGLSADFARISYDGCHSATADTITFETDDWQLTRVLFSDAYELLYGYEKAFVSDFEGSEPFSTDCGWMHLDYADKQLIITAIESYEDNAENWKEYPHQRYARLIFEHTEGSDTLICAQVADALMGIFNGSFKPGDLIIPQKGISLTYGCGYSAPVRITIDGEKHQLNTEDEIFANPYRDFSFSKEWIDVKAFSTGIYSDSPGIVYDHFTITIAPNDTGKERSFSLSFREADEGMMRYYGLAGTQLAE